MSGIIAQGPYFIHESARIDGLGILEIGANSWISYDVWVEMHTHNFNEDDWPIKEIPHTLKIGSQVYIGARAMILGGCRFIADGVLIGGGAVVTRDINLPWSIWVGNPTMLIGIRQTVKTNIQEYL